MIKLPSPLGLPWSSVAPEPLTIWIFAPLKMIFGPTTPISGLGSTLTKGPSASAGLDWTALNRPCSVSIWLFSAETVACRDSTFASNASISYPFLFLPRLPVRARVLRRQRNQPQSMIAEWLGWLCAQSFSLFQFASRGSFPQRSPYSLYLCRSPLR